MLRKQGWIGLTFCLVAPLLSAQSLVNRSLIPASPATASPQSSNVRRSSRKAAPVVLPLMPSGPLRPMPMDQIPATPARISYQDGLLTIAAQNSVLGDILRDVGRLTGATIEVPMGAAANERVAANLGPGSPRDVLARLLDGTAFNYVLLGSSDNSVAVASVILTPKPTGTAPVGDTQTAAANVYQNNVDAMQANRFPQPQMFNQNLLGKAQANAQAADADSDSEDKDEDDSADDSADESNPNQAVQPVAPGVNAQDQPQQPDPNQPNAGPKTPEQILEMLRRQQQPGGAVLNPPQQQPPPQQ